jgi:hypothetical protein
MLNSSLVMDLARAAAQRALAPSELTSEQRIERAFRESLGRLPSREEAKIALTAVTPAGVAGAAHKPDDDRLAAWERLFQGLFGCMDFRYLE